MPDLKDLETKLGRKVPESLVRSLVDGKVENKHEKSSGNTAVKCRANSADLKRLQSKMLFLKQEMVSDPKPMSSRLMQNVSSSNATGL